MKLAGHNKPVALAVLLASALFPLACGTPASAQELLVGIYDVRVAAFSGFPVYSLSLPVPLARQFDLVISDSFQPTGGVTGNLLNVGIRYHPQGFGIGSYPYRLSNPKVSLSLGVGFVSEHGPFPGFGFANTSGFSVGAGATIQLTNNLFGYASGSIVSLGGISNSIVDLGLLMGGGVSEIELGYISFAGSGAPYFGLILPCIFC